jgi:hypothetical protein
MDGLTPNYVAAAFFWLYILAALAFTAIAVYTVLDLRQQERQRGDGMRHNATTHAQKRDDGTVGLFAALASASFIILSINMLQVLIQSFDAWHTTRYATGTHSVKEAYDQTLRAVIEDIWLWSLTTPLFIDFDAAIISGPARFLWSGSELSVTLSVCFYMGLEGP